MTHWHRSTLALALILLFGNLAVAGQPFATASPSVPSSPYFNLFNGTNSPSPYQTLVRPQLESDKNFRENQLDLDRLERNHLTLRKFSRLPPPNLVGPQPRRGVSQNIRATGHETRFLDGRRFSDHKQYFPQPRLR